MKRLWQLIEQEMRSEGLTAKEMAGKLQMDPAQLSRLRTGQLRDLSAETFSNLVAGLRKSSDLHAKLLAAYLSDKLEGNRHIQLKTVTEATAGLSVSEPAGNYETDAQDSVTKACVSRGLNRRVAEALDTLAVQARTNRRLQALLISLADYAREE